MVATKTELNDFNRRFDEEQRIKNEEFGILYRDSDETSSTNSTNNNFKPKNKHKSQ